MDRFEEIGRRLGAELDRMRRVFEEETIPEAERRAADVLRKTSEKLGRAAAKLESRTAARRPGP